MKPLQKDGRVPTVEYGVPTGYKLNSYWVRSNFDGFGYNFCRVRFQLFGWFPK